MRLVCCFAEDWDRTWGQGGAGGRSAGTGISSQHGSAARLQEQPPQQKEQWGGWEEGKPAAAAKAPAKKGDDEWGSW